MLGPVYTKRGRQRYDNSAMTLAILLSLPPANEVCEGYVFTGVCLSTLGKGMHGFIWGACMVLFGVCVVLFGGVYMVLFGGHAWFYSGGMHGFMWGA